MKKIFWFTFTICLCLGIWHLWFKVPAPKKDHWHTFNKTDSSSITSYPTTDEEAKEARLKSDLNKDETKQRSPAAVKKSEKKIKSGQDRTWSLKPNQRIPEKLSYLNRPNKNWKELLGQDIMRFLRPETKVFIKKQGSHTLLERGKGLHVEKVLVKMQSPEGRHYSYNAYVDSQTGKVVRTWNQTIHEPMGKKSLEIKPSGHISPDGVTRY